MIKLKNFKVLLFSLLVIILPKMSSAQSSTFGKGFYRINNGSVEGKSLDIINDGKNNKLQLAKSGKFTGQYWKISTVKKNEMQFFRLTTQWLGETKALTIVEEGDKMTLKMADIMDINSDQASKQFWNIESANDQVQDGVNLFTISNEFTGPMVPLTFENNKLELKFKEVSDATQIWEIVIIK